MENVVCSCLKCGSELGSFRNSWIGIGNSYFSPIYPPTAYINGFVATGDVFAKGPDGSAVQNSVLQDLACKKCATVVGLRCDDAPDGHLLKKNQLILRLAEMNVISEQTGDKVVISVQEKIPLMAPGVKKLPAVRRAATAQPTSRAPSSSSLVEYGKQKSTNGNMLPPPAEDLSRRNLAKFATWTEDAINSQQKDIDRIGGAVARIEKDMGSFKEFMSEVRAELAATRATRKTQEELKQQQLAWLQEDLKELRQETGDFQQDMREEELPSIHNELEQLRQEMDSNNRLVELPDNSSLQSVDRFRGLGESVKRIDHEFNEVHELKSELQRLQRRLADLEGERQESFIFPRTLMDDPTTHSRSSSANNQTKSVSMRARQQPRLMFEVPDNATAPSTTGRLVSPTPPGAFPDSIMDLGTPRRSPARRITSSIAMPSKPKQRRPVATPSAVPSAIPSAIPSEAQSNGLANEPEVAEAVFPKYLPVQKWSYKSDKGERGWKSVTAAFKAFRVEYPKLGAVSESIKVLEDYVNNSNLQNSDLAQKHGQVTSVEEAAEHHDSRVDEPESSLPKRKRDQIEDGTLPSSSTAMTKRRKLSSIYAEMAQSTLPGQNLRSSSIRSSSPERQTTILISSDHGSPELGRPSRFRFGPETKDAMTDEPELTREPILDTLPGMAIRRSSNRLRNPFLGESSNGPPTSSPIQSLIVSGQGPNGASSSHGRSRNSNGALSKSAVKLNSRFTRQRTASNKENAMGPSVSGYIAESTSFSEASNFDTERPFGCGACGKRYKNLEGLTYHKEHTPCEDHEDDVIVKDFRCPTCNKSVTTQEKLKYHITHSPTCKNSQDNQTKGVVAAWHKRNRKSIERMELMSLGRLDESHAAGAEIDALVPTVEADDASMPGSFPVDFQTPASKAADMRSSALMQETETDSIKPFKCGACGKGYKNLGGIKYHKVHSSCTDHADDIIPSDFKCSSCGKRLTQGGLQYHLLSSRTCSDRAKEKGKKKVMPWEYSTQQESQKRRDVLAARERLVRDTLEREGFESGY